MSLVASEPEGAGDFTIVPAGSYPARCFQIVDMGTQRTTFADEVKEQVKVLIGWELLGTDRGDGKPHLMHRLYNNSLHEKATLRKDLKAWRGADFTAEQLKAFNLRKLLNAPCFLSVVHTVRGERTYADVGGCIGVPRGTPVPELWGPMVVFDITAPDWNIFSALPEWMQKMARRALEFPGVPEAIVPPGVAPAHERPPGAGPRPFDPTPASLAEAPAGPPPPVAPAPPPPAVAGMSAPAPGETFGQEPPDSDVPF